MRLSNSLLALPLLLGSCSQVTTVSARFIGSRLAFVPIDNDIGCIHDVSVKEHATDRVVWEVPYVFQPSTCTGGVPLFYGRLPGRKATIAAQPLKTGVEYEISGTAQGSNYFGTLFIIEPITGYRVRDVAGDTGIMLSE